MVESNPFDETDEFENEDDIDPELRTVSQEDEDEPAGHGSGTKQTNSQCNKASNNAAATNNSRQRGGAGSRPTDSQKHAAPPTTPMAGGTAGQPTDSQKQTGLCSPQTSSPTAHAGRSSNNSMPTAHAGRRSENSTHIGTLVDRIEAVVKEKGISTKDEVAHVTKWMKLLTVGWEPFRQAVMKERNRVNGKPLAFAMLTNGNHVIEIAHGLGEMTMELEEHPCEGIFGCFVGDRTATTLEGEAIIQEPPFVEITELANPPTILTKTAMEAAIKATEKFAASGKTDKLRVPFLLPLPLTWVPYFLKKPRTNKEAQAYMTKVIAKWKDKDDDTKEGAMGVRGWFRAACTRDTNDESFSCVDISTRAIPRDIESLKWTTAQLQTFLPRPKTTRQQTNPAVTFAPEVGNEQSTAANRRQEEMLNRLISISETVVNKSMGTDRQSEMPKKLSEVEMCRLLGYCGLNWNERHLLPKIWTDLKKETDRASREAVLSAFIEDLARSEPSLLHFSNQALFDDIINHRFTPGDTYETCHKGFSPLAFLPRTHSEIHAEAIEMDYYSEATVKTVGDVRKHRSKGPPPIPSNDAELIRLNNRDVVFLKAFFTPWSSLVIQEEELNVGLQRQQMDLFSHQASTRDMIPQFLWAKISTRRKFFQQTCTRAMLDVPSEQVQIAKAKLSGFTMLFLLGTEVKIVGVPLQWMAHEDRPAPAKRAHHQEESTGKGTGSGPARNDGRYGQQREPWDATDARKPASKAIGVNPAGPHAFSSSRELNQLLTKFPRVPLNLVAQAAGFNNTTQLPMEGIPSNTCMKWIVFGQCQQPDCKFTHVTNLDNNAAGKLYKALLPGISKVLAMETLPKAQRK